MHQKLLLSGLAGLGSVIAGVANAAVVPITEVYAHNEFSNFTQGEDDMINGSGMNGNPETGEIGWPTGEGLPSTWTATSTGYQSEWQSGKRLSGATNSKIGWAIFDLGATSSLDDL